jgi:hypothetical protein
MARFTVITDENGRLLGAIRSDPIKVGNNTLQFRQHPGPKQKYHHFEVDDALLNKPASHLRKELDSKLGKR